MHCSRKRCIIILPILLLGLFQMLRLAGQERTHSRNESSRKQENVPLANHAGVRKKGNLLLNKNESLHLDSRRLVVGEEVPFGPVQSVDLPKISCGEDQQDTPADLDCRRRLPQAIGIGVKKSGTSAVFFFLCSHPAVATPSRLEIHYWDWYPDKSIDWYRNRMPVTSQYQITVEKSPEYFVLENIPSAIARDVSPDTKLILIMRDPVKRAISDYKHVITMHPQFLKPGLEKKPKSQKYPRGNITYIIKDTFEESVLTADGYVNAENALISTGIYIGHIRNWLKVFPREQILIIDGEEFVRNPIPDLQAAETFLGLSKYFNDTKLYFDKKKRFFCLAEPTRMCQGADKGRRHPDVASDVLLKLYKFYYPYNVELERLLETRTRNMR